MWQRLSSEMQKVAVPRGSGPTESAPRRSLPHSDVRSRHCSTQNTTSRTRATQATTATGSNVKPRALSKSAKVATCSYPPVAFAATEPNYPRKESASALETPSGVSLLTKLLFPGEITVAEVAITCCFFVHWPLQIKRFDDAIW